MVSIPLTSCDGNRALTMKLYGDYNRHFTNFQKPLVRHRTVSLPLTSCDGNRTGYDKTLR